MHPLDQRLRDRLKRKTIKKHVSAPWLSRGFDIEIAPVSCKLAARVLAEVGVSGRIPRPGWERDIAPQTTLTNRAGKCEFEFLYAPRRGVSS